MPHYTESLTEQELYIAEEKKLSEDEEEDEIDHMTFRDFYKIVDDLKKLHPTFSPQRFKEFMKSDDFKDQYDDIVFAYLDDFGYPDLSNDYVKDVVIALSTIGIEIPQKPREENNNVVEDKTDELLPEITVLTRQTSEVEA
jgi:hypothetical protein